MGVGANSTQLSFTGAKL